MDTFITNSPGKTLKQRLIELVSESEQLKFLVGFFYFSGLAELYEALKANNRAKIYILVGLNIGHINHRLIEYAANNKDLSSDYITKQLLKDLKIMLNDKQSDTQEFYEQSQFFIDALNTNRLIIRKTRTPNHAKLYLFYLLKSQMKREFFITGSSNLTKAGLSEQDEFNVEISDYGFKEAAAYFDELWDDSAKITEYDATKQQLLKTLDKTITPFAAFCLVLHHYIKSYQQQQLGKTPMELLKKSGYENYQYQIDAVQQALGTIKDHNGVIIADVVGLGKTIIACLTARQLGKRGLVICPPGLMGDKNRQSGWMKYTEEFQLLGWEVRSLGDLEKTLTFVNETADDIEVIIVDEAHRFRNEDTRNYELLKNICRNKQVILLTATPFNNNPSDIFALLKLFINPKQSSITLDNDLESQFKVFKKKFELLNYIKKNHDSDNQNNRRKVHANYKKLFNKEPFSVSEITADKEQLAQELKDEAEKLAKDIRDRIEQVTIRRNRLDLKRHPEYKKEITALSKVADPQEWFFELTPEQDKFYTKIISQYFGNNGQFNGAIYRPFEYEQEVDDTETDQRPRQQQRNLFDFMRRLLVKRFESSFGAFQKSLTTFKRVTERCQQFIVQHQQFILDRGLLEKIYDSSDEEIEQHLKDYEEKISRNEYPKNHKIYRLAEFRHKDQFLADIASDLELFSNILAELKTLDLVTADPKVSRLIEKLQDELKKPAYQGEPKRKIIIFSEYIDTIKYLEEVLSPTFKDQMLVVTGNLSEHTITAINENFDAAYKKQADKYQLLLATDKLAEGFNLNRAGMVINYDIPWNPVRVIQRLGRINRISRKVFNELYIVNFFPTEQGAEIVKSRTIAATKMSLIHQSLGEDAKIFASDEQPKPADLFKKINQHPDEQEQESFYTRALKDYHYIKEKHPDIIAKLDDYPQRIKTAKAYRDNQLLVFFKKQRLFVIAANTSEPATKPYSMSFETAYEHIHCTPKESAKDWDTPEFWKHYNAVQAYKAETPALNEQSLEQKALNQLGNLIQQLNLSPKLAAERDFLRLLKKDIQEYGSLPDYTLRRITKFDATNVKKIKQLRKELGENYLNNKKFRLKQQPKEIIIAIENKADDC